MSVYLDDAEMAEFLAREGLTRCSDAELLIIADLYDRLGHAESSCGAWFMRYSIGGFVARRKMQRPPGSQDLGAGDPLAFENFLDRNPALKIGKCVIPAWQCKICRETVTEIPAPKDSICPACRDQGQSKTMRLETPSMRNIMTHDEWIAAGRPHWQCSRCKGIYITVTPPDDLVCWQCISPMPANLLALETAKPAKFTAEELRKIEDAVKKDIDEKDEIRQAIGYAYLNGLGWRMTKAQQVIDKALK